MDRRRFFLAATGGLLVVPLVADAQPSASIPRIGLLRPGESTDAGDRASVGAFLVGMRDAGYMPGRDVRIETRYAHRKIDRLPPLARELVALPVDVVVTSNPYTTVAAREATKSVPIVVARDYETDPVVSGWVDGLARPGGSLTGLFLDQPEMSGKLIELLKEAVPGLTRIAVLWDETIDRAQRDATEAAARAAGVVISLFAVRRPEDLTSALGAAVRERAGGLIVLSSPLLSLNRARIAALALKHRLPGITIFTNFPRFGFLMAYGPNQPAAFRTAAAHYVANVLRGRRPADLPIQRPAKFDLAINLHTAKALGLTPPSSLLQRADQVIE